MYQDYINDIVKTYWEKKSEGALAQRLMSPTAANIKDECLFVSTTRFEKKDSRMLADYFGVENEEQLIVRAIKKCHRDRFKALYNYLIGESKKTDPANIILLAWLMDFEDRPYNAEIYDRKLREKERTGNSQEDRRLTENMEIAGDDEVMGKAFKHQGRNKDAISDLQKVKRRWPIIIWFQNNRQKAAFFFFGSFAAISIGFYLVIDKGKLSADDRQQGCMMWVGDHYVQVDCNSKHGDTVLLALDQDRLKNFKKVMLPDTITLYSENKLFYSKKNNLIECYTKSGRHPVDQERWLKPLSRNIIIKYFNHPQQ